MHGWLLAGSLGLAFVAGGWLALVVRALIADASTRRIEQAARTLDPEHLQRLRGYIAEVDEAERAAVVSRRERGATVVRLQ